MSLTNLPKSAGHRGAGEFGGGKITGKTFWRILVKGKIGARCKLEI